MPYMKISRRLTRLSAQKPSHVALIKRLEMEWMGGLVVFGAITGFLRCFLW